MAKRSEKDEGGCGAGTDADARQAPIRVRRDWIWAGILLLVVLVAYSPVGWAGYIWDDDDVVTENPVIVGPLGLKEIWTTSAADICPLTLTTFWAEHKLWGLAPLPYHLVTILLHAACAIVLWRVLLGLRVLGAWLGVALWALHPVQVESVAWVTEMKNTESALFFLLSLLFFAKDLKTPSLRGQSAWNGNYALTLLFAALAMASKSSTVILPVVLCLCAWWMEGRWRWSLVTKLTPIFLMSLIAGIVTVWTQRVGIADHPLWAQTWLGRLVNAGNEIWFYIGKLLWPYPLMPIYPTWQIDSGQWLSYGPLLLIIGVGFIFWLKRDSWARPWFFVSVYFLVALFPVLGLINNSFSKYSFVADHFQYLASIGPLALAGAGMTWSIDFFLPGKRWLQTILGVGVLLILATLSWQRAWAYESEETLWTDALAKNPECWMGYNNLGLAIFKRGQLDEATTLFQKSLEINPDNADAHINLGIAFAQKGRMSEALAQFQRAVEIAPYSAKAFNDLGITLFQMGQADEAILDYQKALGIDPDDIAAHLNLGRALLQKGRTDEAMAHFKEVLRLDPGNAVAQDDLAKLEALGRKSPANK
jgi:tetratricopeptide (TPR) repeat protein